MEINADDFAALRELGIKTRRFINVLKQKKFQKYAGLEEGFSINTLRRSISFVRNYFNLRAEKFPDLKKVFKEYQRLIKENPEATNASIAIKLNFLFPQYKVKTFKIIIANYKTYGTFST